MSGEIEEELREINKFLITKVTGSEIISNHQNLVTIKLTKTKYKQVTVCFRFPEGYPDAAILIEIKSKVFSVSLMKIIEELCDQEAKKHIGRRQVILLTKFLKQFLDDCTILPCWDEISYIKKNFIQDSDTIKVKQKKGLVKITAKEKEYFLEIAATIPNEYPEMPLALSIEKNNFPISMAHYFLCQAREYARIATEAPLKKNPKAPPFQPKVHLREVIEFLIKKCVKRYPTETCPLCNKCPLPSDPSAVVKDGKDDSYVERVYCGHIYHHGCLNTFMKKPPFENGKKCPRCNLRIYHDKWNISPKLAEERWAHKEARQREIDEVVDFLS